MSNKILIIDDEQNFANLLKSFLQSSQKYEIEVAYNIDDALIKIDSYPPDLIVTDLRLKRSIEGLAILDYVNEHFLDIPIIIVTAFGDKENLLKCIEKRPHYLFEKSRDFAKLKEAIAKVLEEKKKKKKPHLATVRSLLFKLPRNQYFNLLLEGIEHLSAQEYTELQEELPLLELSVREGQQQHKQIEKSDREREERGLIPISLINKGNIYYEEKPYRSKKTGKVSIYGYFYLRWVDDKGKPAHQYLGKYEDIKDPLILEKIHEQFPKFKQEKLNKY